MRYGDAIERDYSELQHLRRQLAYAESLAARVQSELKDREKTILHLQRKLRAKIFTHLADLTPNDLAVPDDMFPEADASGLYTLNRHQLVHLLLKKEAVIRGLVRRQWATKLERDAWMLRTYQAQRARGVAHGECLGGRVRGYYSEVQQWAFADRSKAGVERVEERMERAVRRDAPRQAVAAPREDSIKDRVDNWLRDPVELGPLVDFGGNGYYGRRPERGTVKEMMEEEQDSVLWNVSEDEDAADAADDGSRRKSHTKTPDPFAQRDGAIADAGWCASKYVCTALASNYKAVNKMVQVFESDGGAGGRVGLSVKKEPIKWENEPVREVDPSFWLPDEAESDAPQDARFNLQSQSVMNQPAAEERLLSQMHSLAPHTEKLGASRADKRLDPARDRTAPTIGVEVGLRQRRKAPGV